MGCPLQIYSVSKIIQSKKIIFFMPFVFNQEIFYNSRILNTYKPNFCLDRICKIKYLGPLLNSWPQQRLPLRSSLKAQIGYSQLDGNMCKNAARQNRTDGSISSGADMHVHWLHICLCIQFQTDRSATFNCF